MFGAALYSAYYFGGGPGLALPNPLAVALRGRIAIVNQREAKITLEWPVP
jgi:hypothetical protein